MINFIHQWSKQRSSWALLFFSVLGLELTALYFQYGMDLRPCIMCIYQRTALFGVLLAALLPLLVNQRLTRALGYAVWGVSSVWGFVIAKEHVDIIKAANPFVPCEIVPNFPVWLPLHEWLPRLFAANGDCLENSWQFAGMGMAEWMMVIFGFYTLLLAVVLAAKLAARRTAV
ncbi:disulfide bond formation protein DsbB [Alteromonas oceanisediminis]|uniref:disulfide bond formation protein DsbB n=1 Tax=Alteromonas oceanisediminis TaxID=2836180 RepID=UPI001BDAD3CD|nr:disulfide bond formation protein DsbB [Alteromonas oceanisediminis]MBT0587455.1 disulfide bond formation protein DsbB [Alteromonas oceanisediminis]